MLAVACAVAATLSLAACGDNVPQEANEASSAGKSKISGEFQGAGASSQQGAVEAWIAMYQRHNRDVKIAYNPTGSGAGISTFLTGATAWAATDAPLDAQAIEQSKSICAGGGSAFDVPVYVSGITVAYNLKGLSGQDKHLNMDPATIARIFDGKISSWDDPAIKEQNPKANLPAKPITVVHRSDKSGTTKNFLSYLKDTAGEDWPYEAGENWPNDVGQGSKGASGVASTVGQADGTIGYVDASKVGTLGTVSLKVGQAYVPYSPQAASTVVDSSKIGQEASGPGRLVIELDHGTQAANAYPLLLVSYDVACPAYQDADTARFIKSWLTYEVSRDGQQLVADNAGAVPLSAATRAKVMKSISLISVSSPSSQGQGK
ncbi:phosphate ABC transporter substrate-binding protein PstS [Bifidobacterium aemilianum]|uniref:Phosphate-binding protein n=1 Tax=Bifidobacterium aemilianum TaxID=2493120 RepID=A0A366K7A6_9BIFI|nr:phosphate ABC transporter substrate-binding protein PstS [Bifidobacterium aemilianum]RBP97630.1 phosphate ABC transporter substrate-binding protein PstS [Bifidobacterium aemilianum]